MVIGILLIFFSFSFYRYFFIFYRAFFYFCVIFFIRWFSSGGRSFVFEKRIFNKWDRGWMELTGGQGSYGFVFLISGGLDFFKKVGLGLILIFVLLLGFGFVY